MLMSKNDFEKLVRKKPFIKIANKISLLKWDDAEEILQVYFEEIIEMLAD